MINNDDDFLDAIENRTFINNRVMQESLVGYCFDNPSVDKLTLLWLVQQNYDVIFSHIILEASYLEHAGIEQLLDALSIFSFNPTSFVDRIVKEGSSEQIDALHVILKDFN